MSAPQQSSFGDLMRRWRTARGISQLDLGLEANVSTRHISYIENGRSNPSREMVLMLANVLDVPLRERNALLQAAGYAPVFPERGLDDPGLRNMRQALEQILTQLEMFGAIVFDRCCDIVMVNRTYLRLVSLLTGQQNDIVPPYTLLPLPRLNLLKMTLSPDGFRPLIANWEEVAQAILARFYHETMWSRDEKMNELLEEAIKFPDVPSRWLRTAPGPPRTPIIPLELRLGEEKLRLFTMLTTLGTPLDVTLQELRIESYHPADEHTVQILKSLNDRR